MKLDPRYYTDKAGTAPANLATTPVGTTLYVRISAGTPPTPIVLQSKTNN
jgi:hypothetical protein